MTYYDTQFRKQSEALPRSTFSTKALQQQDGINASMIQQAWVEAMSVFFSPKKFQDKRLIEKYNPDNTTEGYIDNFLFPGFMTVQVSASGQSFSRSKQAIAKDGLDGFLIQCVDDGEIHANSNNTNSSALKGGIQIIDMAREGTAYTSRFNCFSLLIPRADMESTGIDVSHLHLLSLPEKNPIAYLMNRHVHNIHKQAASITIKEAQALHEPTIALLKAAISTDSNLTEQAAPAIKRNLLHEIRRYIDQNLNNPSLTTEAIVQKFGLSRASLYRLAEPLGGIQRFIRNRRLKHAFQILTGEASKGASLTALAYDLGFGSEVSFRRAFKEAYDMTPSEAREQSYQAYRNFHMDLKKPSSKDQSTIIPLGDLLYKRWVHDLAS